MIKKIREKLFTREIITYLIAGVMTTLVNFAASYLLYDVFGVEENLTTGIAWVVAVIFAYLVNNFWVFRQGNEGSKQESVKFIKFVIARLLTLVVELGGVFIFVTKLEIEYWLVKIPLAVVVTVLNYIFSKVFIFIKNKSSK